MANTTGLCCKGALIVASVIAYVATVALNTIVIIPKRSEFQKLNLRSINS